MQAIKTLFKVLLMFFVGIGVIAACGFAVIVLMGALRFLPVLLFILAILIVIFGLIKMFGIRIESDRF